MSAIDQTSLLLHVLAAVGLTAGGVVQVMAGGRLRAATERESIRQWAGFARGAGPLLVGSAILSLATGGHLAGAVWTSEASSGFSHPFITLGAVALVVLAPVGPMLGGARLRRLIAASSDDSISEPDLRRMAGDRTLWSAVHSLVGLAVGLISVMVWKPGSWAVTAIVLLVGFVGGWLSGRLVGDG